MILTTKEDFEQAVLKGEEIKTNTIFYTGELDENKQEIGTYVKDKGLYCGISPEDGKQLYLALRDEPEELNWEDAMKRGRIPSKREWMLIFINKKKINKGLKKAGGEPLKNDWYWSSTMYNNNSWYLRLSDGYTYNYFDRTTTLYVRCSFAF